MTAPLPAGLSLSPTPSATDDCGFTTDLMSGTPSFSAGSLGGGASCSASFAVEASITGELSFVSGALSSDQGTGVESNEALLDVSCDAATGFVDAETVGECECDAERGLVADGELACQCSAALKLVGTSPDGCQCDASLGFTGDILDCQVSVSDYFCFSQMRLRIRK